MVRRQAWTWRTGNSSAGTVLTLTCTSGSVGGVADAFIAATPYAAGSGLGAVSSSPTAVPRQLVVRCRPSWRSTARRSTAARSNRRPRAVWGIGQLPLAGQHPHVFAGAPQAPRYLGR